MKETDLPTASTTAATTKAERKPRKRELKNLLKRDGIWYFHKLVKGKREFNGRKTPFTLATSDLVVAKAKRDALLRASGGAEVDRVLGRTQKKVATIQEVFDAFLLADYPREVTRKKYVRDMRLILRRVWGERDLAKAPITDLTAKVAQDYQDGIVAEVRAQREAALAAGDKEAALRFSDEGEEMQNAKFNTNRTMSQAKSIFANEKPFRHLHVPLPTGFLEVDPFPLSRDSSFTPFSAAELAVFADESDQLKAAAHAGDAAAEGKWLLYLAMRWLGLRNSEAEFCKPAEWIAPSSRGGHVLRITNRPYFLVKAPGSIRDLPLADWLLQELQRFTKDREWLIPGPHVTARHDVTHYTFNDWMEEVYERAIADGRLPAGTPKRTAYDFRKQAGTELYEKTKDILAVSRWLGHQGVATTMKWYVNVIRGLPSLA